jgi:energy-coupling factor transporter ATP-binding protein EcfA2
VAESHPYDLPVPRRRLVALAALLVTDPDLLLLDEPTAALDANSRARVVAVVRDVVARGGAVLAITHDAEFAHEALDRGVRLEHGRVAWEGAVRDVLDNEHLTRSAALTVAMRLGLGPGRDRRADVAAALRGLGPERN